MDSRLASGAVRLLAVMGAAAGLVLYRVADPVSSRFFPRCAFHDLTGLLCPGSGVQRAAHALLNGHVGEALGFNAFAVLVLPVFAAALALRWTAPDAARRLAARVPAIAYRGLAWGVVAFWVLRNVPAFSVLAP